jgi:hypothetical protein
MVKLVLRGTAALVFVVSVVAVGAVDAGASAAHGRPRWWPAHDPNDPPTVEVVADHLNNPRQLAIKGGAVYVAEAGTGGSDCEALPEGVPCVGLSGSVTRVKHGTQQRVQTGLLSVLLPGEGEVVGVDAVAFKGNQLYGIATGACMLEGIPIPPEALAQAGQVLKLLGGDAVEPVGDASTIECTTDPDGQGPDTDPYGLAIRGRTFYVADAAGNDIVKIRNGETSVAAVLSTTGQPVPTSLAFGPDGALYIGTLNFEGGPGSANVYRLDVHTGAVSVYAEGLFAITGIAFDQRGRLYGSEFTTGFGPEGPLPDGDVVVIPWGGGMQGRKVLGAGSLHFPGGVAVDRTGVYVSNWSIATGEDGPFGPGNHGQLVRISSPSHGRSWLSWCDWGHDQIDTSWDARD